MYDWSVMYTNARSIKNKFNELCIVVNNLNPHFVMITETWLHSGIPDSCVGIQGFHLFRSDNAVNRGHDGVCIYVRDDIVNNFSVSMSSHNFPGIDNLFLDISSPGISLYIGCIYRPHPSPSDILLCDHFISISRTKSNIFLGGDFNFRELSWPITSAPVENSMAETFVMKLEEAGLSQLVDQPTRFGYQQNPSMLDLLLTNFADSVFDIQYLNPLGRSDHSVIAARLQLSSLDGKKIAGEYRQAVNYNRLKEILSNICWEELLNTGSVEEDWKCFLQRVNDAVDQSSTIREVKYSPANPWISGELLAMMRRKKALWQRYLRHRSDANYNTHRQYSNQLIYSIRQAKNSYQEHIASSKDRKKFFKYVRSSLNSKVSTPLLRNPTGDLCSTNFESAEVMAQSFATSFTIEPDGGLPPCSSPRSTSSVESVEFAKETVKGHLNLLDPNTSPGPDKLSARILKSCSEFLCYPIARLLELSFRTGVLPADWLKAGITPIFKKGDKLSPSNYRPISLLCIVCKIGEKIILEKMLPFLLSNNIIPDEQHGFIPGRSVLTCQLQCLDQWTKSFDQNIPTDVIYLDFSKAFDRVPFNRLLAKLDHFGIRGELLSWIGAFLRGRQFSVRVGDSSSSPRDVTSGVPQGSVLGPVLFLAYVSDMKYVISSSHAFYADDLKLWGSSNDSHATLQRDLDSIADWSRTWLLPLNIDKCRTLHIGTNNPRHPYFLGHRRIETTSQHNDLGVLVSDDLSWSAHVRSITARANSVCYLIRRTFSRCSVEICRLLYTSYVRPILEHAGPAWYPVLRRDQLLLESIQRRATRIPYGVVRPSYDDRLILFDLQPFLARRERGDLIVTYRSLHGLFGCDLSGLFVSGSNALRGHPYKLYREFFRTRSREFFLSNRVFHRWNSLPGSVVCADSVNCFKNRLDSQQLARIL